MINDWVSEFRKFMFSGNVKEARAVTLQHFPQKLYKYRSVNDYTIENISKNTVWLSSPLSMNDPYESSIYTDFNRTCDYFITQDWFWEHLKNETDFDLFTETEKMEIRTHASPYEYYWECFRGKFVNSPSLELKIGVSDIALKENLNFHVEELIQQLKNKVRFCSFSEKNDSLLMWSHYADQHKGITIEYDFNPSTLKNYVVPIIYSDKVFDCTNYLIEKSLQPLISILSSLQKTRDWAYENEWRLLFPNNIIKDDQNILVPEPTAIYLGSCVNNLDSTGKQKLNKIIELATIKNIPIIQMKLNRDNFKMGTTSNINLGETVMPKLPLFK